MGIKFACPHCGTPLNVKSELAGKRGRCPQCQEKIEIPAEDSPGAAPATIAAASVATQPGGVSNLAAQASNPAAQASNNPAAQAAPQTPTFVAPANPAAGPSIGGQSIAGPSAGAGPAGIPTAGAPVDLIAEAPQLQWYVMPPGAESQYGPAVGEEFRNWINEGRVTADTLVWRQDWAEWKAAGVVFPELQGPVSAMPVAPIASSAAPAGFALPTAAGALPTASGPLPVAAMAYPAVAEGLGGLNAGAGGFPVSAPAPVASGRRGQYRPRSNTGPIIVISILVLAMIPLSYFVVQVIRQQIANQPPAAASPKQAGE